MQRRRMSRLSRMALSVALDVEGNPDFSIFASRHGELARTRGILGQICDGTEVSPTAFSQSVHNTSSGLYSIVVEATRPSTSIGAGAETFAYAWIEAQAYLAEHPEHRVLLVDFDEIVPQEYRSFLPEASCDHALALLLRAGQANGISLTRTEAPTQQRLPLGPQFLAWLQSDSEAIVLGADGHGWRWQR